MGLGAFRNDYLVGKSLCIENLIRLSGCFFYISLLISCGSAEPAKTEVSDTLEIIDTLRNSKDLKDSSLVDSAEAVKMGIKL